jgi:hypothetical protein
MMRVCSSDRHEPCLKASPVPKCHAHERQPGKSGCDRYRGMTAHQARPNKGGERSARQPPDGDHDDEAS